MWGGGGEVEGELAAFFCLVYGLLCTLMVIIALDKIFFSIKKY